MKLRRIRLHGFGVFNRGLDVTFSPDKLNLILGRNEAGKSTLINSIFGVLFGFRDLNLARKYEPWDEHESYAGELEFQRQDGSRISVYRDFNSNDTRIHGTDPSGIKEEIFCGRADPRGARDEDQRYFEHLGDLLGFRDEAIFRATVFFGQQSLTTAVSDQIRRLLSGSTSMDYKGALHELHGRYSELTTENPWRSGAPGRGRIIEQTRTDLETERTQLQQGREALSRALELEAESADLEIRLRRVDEDITYDRASLEAHERLFRLFGRREEADRRYDAALSRRDNFKRYADREREVGEQVTQRYSHLKNVAPDFPSKVRAYARDEEDRQHERDQLVGQREDLEQLRPIPNTLNGVILGGLLGGVAMVTGILTPLGTLIGSIAAATGCLLGFSVGRALGTGFQEQKAALQERIRQLQDSVTQRQKRCEEFLAEAGPSLLGRDPEQVVAEFAGFTELREERKRLLAAMKALGDREAVEVEFETASRERGTVGAALEEVLEQHPSLARITDRGHVGSEIERIRQRLAEMGEVAARDRTRLEEARIELAALGARTNFNLAELEEDVREKEHRLERYDLERDALKVAIDHLDGCVKDFQDGDVLRLSEEMSGIFAKITGEKYTRVHLGAGLEPVISRGDAVPISPENLSQGAQDQLYFAMRIAMARHLSRKINLPLFLDDPFVNFDEERLAVTREVLENLGDHQVIMVTCNRDYEPWTDSVLDLDQPQAA